MVRPASYFISLTFKCQSVVVVFVGSLAVAGRVLWTRVYPSFCPASCRGVFLESKSPIPKDLFLAHFLGNFVVNLHWICSIMKIHIICCVPAQILSLGKIFFLSYRSECSQPIRLQCFKSPISPEQSDETATFFACWYKFTKLIENMLVGHGQKQIWPIWSLDSEFECMD